MHRVPELWQRGPDTPVGDLQIACDRFDQLSRKLICPELLDMRVGGGSADAVVVNGAASSSAEAPTTAVRIANELRMKSLQVPGTEPVGTAPTIGEKFRRGICACCRQVELFCLTWHSGSRGQWHDGHVGIRNHRIGCVGRVGRLRRRCLCISGVGHGGSVRGIRIDRIQRSDDRRQVLDPKGIDLDGDRRSLLRGDVRRSGFLCTGARTHRDGLGFG